MNYSVEVEYPSNSNALGSSMNLAHKMRVQASFPSIERALSKNVMQKRVKEAAQAQKNSNPEIANKERQNRVQHTRQFAANQSREMIRKRDLLSGKQKLVPVIPDKKNDYAMRTVKVPEKVCDPRIGRGYTQQCREKEIQCQIMKHAVEDTQNQVQDFLKKQREIKERTSRVRTDIDKREELRSASAEAHLKSKKLYEQMQKDLALLSELDKKQKETIGVCDISRTKTVAPSSQKKLQTVFEDLVIPSMSKEMS
eukprot:TRINITY_DN2280_c0_g1_i2.p1 TRINITY_DN2280_c0_g1~~TRINITY_DN2280_c0_g1_i2.p1  ORF type:complete len:254 (-),score=55.03 TRINITY_DN2280_c0_g1_i2:309-1070(-)